MKRKHYVLLGILVLFLITNPSISSFKAYRGQFVDDPRREFNLFFFGIYNDGGQKYLGVLGNFIYLTQPQQVTKTVQDSLRYSDSIRSVDSALMSDSSNHIDEFGIPIRKTR